MATLATDDAIIKLIEEKLIKVYKDGLIYSETTKRYLTTGTPESNKSVTFRYKGETYACSKARVLWLAFRGLVPDGKLICVKEIGQPVILSNIDAMTQTEANTRLPVIGKKLGGEDCFFARFTNEEVLNLRREYKTTPFALRPRAKELGTDHNTLSHLISGKTYKDVPEACEVLNRYKPVIDRNDPNWLEKEKDRKRLYMQSRRDKGLVKTKQPRRKPLSPKPIVVKPAPEVYHDRKKLEKEATELLKQDRLKQKPPKVIKEPKPKIIKEPKSKVIREIKPKIVKEPKFQPVQENLLEVQKFKPIDYAAQREQTRVQREEHLARLEEQKIERELQAAQKEREAAKRIALIKSMAEKRKDKSTTQLSPFKQFAVYHLHSKFQETFEAIGAILSIDDVKQVELGFKSFKPENYEAVKAELIKKYGRDSMMLSRIRLFEGDFNNVED